MNNQGQSAHLPYYLFMQGMLAYTLFGGHVWLASNALLGAWLAISLAFSEQPPRWARPVGFLLLLTYGVALLGLPPLPYLILIPWAISIVAGLTLGQSSSSMVIRRSTVAAALLLIAAATLTELRSFFPPAPLHQTSRLVVLGDSLASGGFEEEANWPLMVADRLKVDLVDLSLPSETTATALMHLDEMQTLSAPGTTFLIEVGGNDMLERVPLQVFIENLERLASVAGSNGGRVMIMELPSLPVRWSYPAAQRRVALQTGSVLAPRRLLLGALTCDRCVSDGLHLTDRGHQVAAERIAAWIE